MKQNNYITIAVGVIINKQDELLTVQKNGSSYYQLPGGKIEGEERPVDSLIRELHEELHLDLDEKHCVLLGVHEAQAVNEKGKTVRGYVFQCEFVDQFEKIEPHAELREIRWVKKTEIEEVKLANLLKQFALPIWMEN